MLRWLQEAEEGLTTGAASDVLLPAILGVIMFGMGLGLKTSDFRMLATQPRPVIAGLIGQLILLPIAGTFVVFVGVLVFDLETELALGLLLLASVPGGATSNLLALLARGDTALSVSLTAITSVGSFLLTPMVLYGTTWALWAEAELISVSFVDVLMLTVAVVAGPVLLGMVAGRLWPRLAIAADRPLRIFSIVVLVVLIAAIIAGNKDDFWQFAAATIPAAGALNLLALGAGFLTAKLARVGEAQRRSIVIEVGFQNGAFGIVLAVTQLESARIALMPGFYSLFMYITGGALAWAWARRVPKTVDADAAAVEQAPI